MDPSATYTTSFVSQTEANCLPEKTLYNSVAQQSCGGKQELSKCSPKSANIIDNSLTSCTEISENGLDPMYGVNASLSTSCSRPICSVTSSTSVVSSDSGKDMAHSMCSSSDMMSTSINPSYDMPSQSDSSVSILTTQSTNSMGDAMQPSVASCNDMASQSLDSVIDQASGNADSSSVTTTESNCQTPTTMPLTARRSLGLSGQKKRKRRGSAWSDEQTEFLMEIWSRHAEPKEVEDINHNAPVYRLIAKAMEEHGSPKTWEQCKTRIHTLKRAYKLTRDEIKSGATNITYCRHFDKLEIIMGDNETTTPQMLSDLLELRRKQNRGVPPTRSVSAPQKRKVAPTDKPIKRVNTQGSDKNLAQYHQAQQEDCGLTQIDTSSADNYFHTPCQPQYGQPKQILQQPSLQQPTQHQQEITPPIIQLSGVPASDPSPPLPPPYQSMTTATMLFNPALGNTHEINNNDIVIKHEKQATDSVSRDTLSTVTAQTWTVPHTAHTPQKHELEKMRLDLELRKIDMERNKLEMEERQRREERDHQYRMLQLLMFGLGQQNSAHALSGQAAEQAVAQAQNSTDLSRALENGLVPGGPHTANEKGLSFNEI